MLEICIIYGTLMQTTIDGQDDLNFLHTLVKSLNNFGDVLHNIHGILLGLFHQTRPI